MGGQKQPSTPKAPNAAKLYRQGLDTYLRYLPTLLQQEQAARGTYDPQRIVEQQQLQSAYGPTQYKQQLDALAQLDPEGTALRKQQAGMISSDLASGYELPDQLRTEYLNQFRGSQAARGNDLGTSAASAEAGFLGQAAIQDYQRRLGNAGNFLNSPTPEQQLLTVQPVSPDRSSQYVNPNAGFAGQQFGLSNYSNLLAQQAASGARPNPWASALGGAASGAAAGASFGPYGAIIGGVAGGALGYFGSDARLKENIVRVGTEKGFPVYEFQYKYAKGKRFRGVMASDVVKLVPKAVRSIGGFLSDFMAVDYNALGMELKEV